jgi:hypothetical protein
MRTLAKGKRTTSPERACAIQRKVFDMKLFGRRNVHPRPDSRTASSVTGAQLATNTTALRSLKRQRIGGSRPGRRHRRRVPDRL